jgi:hypothetical protein
MTTANQQLGNLAALRIVFEAGAPNESSLISARPTKIGHEIRCCKMWPAPDIPRVRIDRIDVKWAVATRALG